MAIPQRIKFDSMRLGFYYHINAAVVDERIYLPSLLGVFLDDLSLRVEHLTLLLHTVPYNASIQDYELAGSNIGYVNLGEKKSFLHRLLWGKHTLKNLDNRIDFDVLLVRAPTPLAPALYAYYSGRCPVSFMMVGDYVESHSPYFSAKWLLDLLYERMMNKHILPFCLTMVNSQALKDKYDQISKETIRIKTTTLRSEDFYYREDTCLGDQIHLLYVGRYDWQKGFKELFEAVVLLKNSKSIVLHMVGWDDDKDQKNRIRMEKTIKSLSINDNVVIEGYKRIGSELNEMYRQSDIFVLPSYAEGFPRCIREAMANGVPVIATNVGGIPGDLSDGVNAILIPPHDTDAIVGAITNLLENKAFRRTIIKNAYLQAEDSTLVNQNKRIINILQDELE